MSQSKRLRMGVIGCGGVAQMMHLPYLQSLPDLFEIAAISDLSPGVLQAMGEKYGIPEDRRFTDYKNLLALDIEAVLVLTGGNHHPWALAAVQAGKHVLVEKPLCYTVREADELMDAARKAAKELRQHAGYFRDNQRRMQYLEMRENGYPIGSGMVESGCKQFRLRFAGPGMRWSRQGAERLLPVRAAIMSRRFDALWAAAYRPPLN